MIVVAIIGLLAGIAVPSFLKARTETQTTLCIENMRLIFHSSHLYEIETGRLLTGGANGVFLRDALYNNGYVKKLRTFECPTSGVVDNDDYTLVYSGNDLMGVRCTLDPGGHVMP